jgi:hypothetical protein
VTYKQYETVEGVKYPMEMNLQMPGMPMTLVSKVESVTFD